MVAILGFSAYWLAQGTMTLGTITAFLMYLFGLTFPLMAMAMFFSNLNKAAGAATRLTEISQLPVEQTTATAILTDVETIKFQHLNFSRGDKAILKQVNYQFTGTGLAIVVGESGSGKSTLLSQLLGFYPETFDNVLINEQPISNYQLASLRQCIAWVDQEPKLLHATIRENLTLGLKQPVNDDIILQTLTSVGLQSWLTRIDSNLDLIVSEQTHQFSGGEKQRFAIARAILRQAKVILLDEPTSALDDTNKAELMKLLRKLSLSMRVIMISHHMELIEPSDEIIAMVDGAIVDTREALVG